MNAQGITLKSELYEDWQMLWPVLEVLAFFIVLLLAIALLRFVIRYVLQIILTIRGNKL